MSLPFHIVSSLAIAGSAFLSFAQVLPKPVLSDAFEVRQVSAERVGETAILYVDRTIRDKVAMSFSVRVFEGEIGGWREVCAMSSGVIEYRPDAILPDPVTLDWWTWGECPNLPDGPARIVTTWTPANVEFSPFTVVTDVP